MLPKLPLLIFTVHTNGIRVNAENGFSFGFYADWAQATLVWLSQLKPSVKIKIRHSDSIFLPR
jgi:hypothetical protein